MVDRPGGHASRREGVCRDGAVKLRAGGGMPSGPRSAGLRAPGIPRRKGCAEWVPPGPPLVTPLALPLSDKCALIRLCPCRPPPSASLQPGATSLRAVAPGFRSALHNRGLCKLPRPTTAHTRRPRLRRGRPALVRFAIGVSG